MPSEALHTCRRNATSNSDGPRRVLPDYNELNGLAGLAVENLEIHVAERVMAIHVRTELLSGGAHHVAPMHHADLIRTQEIAWIYDMMK